MEQVLLLADEHCSIETKLQLRQVCKWLQTDIQLIHTRQAFVCLSRSFWVWKKYKQCKKRVLMSFPTRRRDDNTPILLF